MIKRKLNLFIFLIVGIFLSIDIFWYYKTSKQLDIEHTQKQSILFYNLKGETTRLLDKLMYQYTLQKELLEKKHKIVYNYLKNHGDYTKISLDEIHKIINTEYENFPYNIYVTDTNLVIQNSTYKADIGLNLDFAKSSFLRHHSQNMIGVSTPIYKESTQQFFSYSDSFLNYKDEKGNLLQVSYTYPNIENYIRSIKKIIQSNEDIKEIRAYTKSLDGQSYTFEIGESKNYVLDVQNIYDGIKEGKNILTQIKDKELFSKNIIKDKINYRAMYLSQNNSILENDTKILYSVLFDESTYLKQKENLLLMIFIISFIGLLIIFFTIAYINKLIIQPISFLQKVIKEKELCKDTTLMQRKDEIGILAQNYNYMFAVVNQSLEEKDMLLKDKNRFVNDSIHEINSPLSIISTNNSLRDMTQGENEYGQNIKSALKILNNTMNDLSFSMTQDKIEYTLIDINLKEFIEQRVKYFESIAQVSDLEIFVDTLDQCSIKISEIELLRLIDNNLSNAIKYSFPHTTITIKLTVKENICNMTFINKGYKIQNTENIFQRYYREDNKKGGYGLGLNIVQSICQKYKIAIDLQSSEEKRTTFSYRWKI